MSLRSFLRDRTGFGESPRMIAGGASFAYVFGWVLVFLLALEGITGAALAAFYSPSTTDAWASVAYIQDQATWGWLVRGLHHHGGGAFAIVAGAHLLQTALFGAYKKPRELTWWIGILLMILVLVWAVTGYVLRWDQAGYWANKVEVGIAAGTPIIGPTIRAVAIGGNDYGNLTLTRFYMLHVVALPAIVVLATVLHIKLARRHGTTPHKSSSKAGPAWPDQTLRNTIAMAAVFATLLGVTISAHGVELAAPADPSQAYDARPLWYFRWLFELRHLAGSAEKIVALLAPAVVGGILVALPLLDRGDDRSIRKRLPFIGAVAGLFAVIAALTIASLAHDAGDPARADALAAADKQATRARGLAQRYGVPTTGALDVYTTPPMWQARTIFATRCRDCHDAQSADRKGPIIATGHGDRAWLKGFLKDPNGAAYYGKTKLSATDVAMKPVELPTDDMEDLVEALYAESGAKDIDGAKRDRGLKIFQTACTDCHSRDAGVASTSGPGLGGLNSRDYLTSFIGNPKSPVHMGSDSEMPRFDAELSIVQRDALAGYLEWLRTASKSDVDALGPL